MRKKQGFVSQLFLYYTSKRMFAKRIKSLSPSATMAIDAKAKELKSAGVQVINLSVGEPDFQTPDNIKKAAIQAIKKGFTFYTAPNGILPLREAVAKKFAQDNGLHYTPSQILIGSGSKQLLYSALQVLCNPGDEVLIATPTWTTFVEQIKLAGAKPILVPLQPPFKLTAKDLEKYVTAKTKVLLLNSPSNPTGEMIDPEEMKKIGAFVLKHNLFVIADEIYEKLVYTTKHVSIAALSKELFEKTITMNGVSKSYAMTGWRIGYAGGPQEIITAMNALQSQMIGSNSSISQMAALEALTGEQSSLTAMKQAFVRRRKLCLNLLSQIPQLSVVEPEGAFYLFISLRKVLNKTYPTATVWAEKLLEKEHVAIIPGEAFLCPGYIRICYAASDNDLKEALQRIKRFLNR